MLLVSPAVISSCNKYEDGPKFTLMTKKARLTGDWTVKEYEDENGNVVTVNNGDYVSFEKDGDYKATVDNITYSGTWDFSDDKEDLKITYTYGATAISTSYEIRRLTNKELWIEDEDNIIRRFEAK